MTVNDWNVYFLRFFYPRTSASCMSISRRSEFETRIRECPGSPDSAARAACCGSRFVPHFYKMSGEPVYIFTREWELLWAPRNLERACDNNLNKADRGSSATSLLEYSRDPHHCVDSP